MYILIIIHLLFIQSSSSSSFVIFIFEIYSYNFNSSSSDAGTSCYITISAVFIDSTAFNISSVYPPGISIFIGGLLYYIYSIPKSCKILYFSSILFF